MKDPIVEEVRRYRMEHATRFGGDLGLICEDLRRIQRECGCRIVRRPPKLIAPTKELQRGTNVAIQPPVSGG
jgi:molybdopterin converting factor small subunit